MRTVSFNSGVITAVTALAVIGVGLAVTSSGEPGEPPTDRASLSFSTLAASSPTASTSATAPSPTASRSATATASATASATSSATGTASDGSECAAVYKVAAPTGDAVGKLCTAVTGSGTKVSKITITYTATSTCSGKVTLRASGIDAKGAEFAKVSDVACSSGTATTSFQPITATTSGTSICGMLVAPETYTGAQACVAIS